MDQPADDARIEQDANRIITDWDAGAERLFGWSRAEAIDRKSDTIIPERNHDRHAEGLRALFAGGRGVDSRRITMRHRDGHEFVADLAISTVGRDDGDRAVAIARAITHTGESEPAWPADAGDVRYREILDQIEDACAVVDLRGAIDSSTTPSAGCSAVRGKR